ncbi:MAG TPA: hypothetical protein VGF24_11570 [Vicinamibacterales bacterium]|jgi:hypothetical protein
MNANVNRRMFVRSVAAGVPVLAGTAYGLAVASPSKHEHDREGSGDFDPVFDHVVREIASVIDLARQRGFAGEDARAVAAQLRFAIVRGAQIGIDGVAKKALRSLTRSPHGPSLTLDVDTARVKAQLKRYGMEVDDRWFRSARRDDAARRKALDVLANDGVTGVLSHAAGILETMGTSIDRVQGPVRRVQIDSFVCWPLLAEIEVIAVEAAAVCAVSSVEPGLDVACATMQATVSALLAIYYAFCH